jgi:putative heme-binding domain-containing protein
VRDPAVPLLEQMSKQGELPAGVLPELRAVYTSVVPVTDWQLIGPFPQDEKSYRPETEFKPDSTYTALDKQVKWRTKKADAKQHGFVNLEPMFSPNSDVSVYGHAEVVSSSERDATLVIGSDDTIIVWLNGQKVFSFQGNRGWAADQDKVNIKLKAGKNELLIRCGNASGPWGFSVAVSAEEGQYAFLKGGGKKLDLEAYRAFARKTKGDAGRGEKLFLDVKGLACVKCHSVGGQGGTVGPAIDGIGAKYAREELMTSVLEPSKTIANGYETIIITTVQGKALQGVFKGETGDAVNYADADGKLHSVPKKDIDEKAFSPVSTMPNGLNEGMTLQDFADLIAFLEARREEPKKK